MKSGKWRMVTRHLLLVTGHRPSTTALRPPAIAPVLHHALKRGTVQQPVTSTMQYSYRDFTVPAWDTYRRFVSGNWKMKRGNGKWKVKTENGDAAFPSPVTCHPSPVTIHCSLFTIHYSPTTARRFLFTICVRLYILSGVCRGLRYGS